MRGACRERGANGQENEANPTELTNSNSTNSTNSTYRTTGRKGIRHCSAAGTDTEGTRPRAVRCKQLRATESTMRRVTAHAHAHARGARGRPVGQVNGENRWNERVIKWSHGIRAVLVVAFGSDQIRSSDRAADSGQRTAVAVVIALHCIRHVLTRSTDVWRETGRTERARKKDGSKRRRRRRRGEGEANGNVNAEAARRRRSQRTCSGRALVTATPHTHQHVTPNRQCEPQLSAAHSHECTIGCKRVDTAADGRRVGRARGRDANGTAHHWAQHVGCGNCSG